MAKPIIVGYDPKSSDRSPVAFALRAARFTGARLVVASVGSGAGAEEESTGGRVEEDLVPTAGAL